MGTGFKPQLCGHWRALCTPGLCGHERLLFCLMPEGQRHLTTQWPTPAENLGGHLPSGECVSHPAATQLPMALLLNEASNAAPSVWS
ncbi:rCG50756, partial [Rattus norvegicus]